MMVPLLRRSVLALALLTAAAPARADDGLGAPRSDAAIDGAILAGAVAAALAPAAIPLRAPARWDTQLLGALDEHAFGQLSHAAAQLSDLALALAIGAPAVYLTGSTIDDADGDRLVLYAEALAVDLALVQIAKHLVHRPRPYVYHRGPAAAALVREEGDDAWRSFYSSHAALSFGAAVAGAYLLGESTTRPTARAVAWGAGFALAAATSNLRVRAGRHFYSDVLVGGLIGAAVGYAVPALHARDEPHAPSRADLTAAGVGLFGGIVASSLVPLRDDGRRRRPHAVMVDRVHVGPIALRDGAGVAISGRVRSRGGGRVPLSRHGAAAGDTAVVADRTER
jgi:membrane-associated phospholipid phosphatase